MSTITPHKETGLNALRLFTFGLGGYYLYKAYQKEGSLLGATGKDKPFDINTDIIVDTIIPHVNIPAHQKELVKHGLKEFAHTLKEKILNKK